jgi:endonuclease/exonuclease/phosphatase (EEP) superfamily protein YafD
MEQRQQTPAGAVVPPRPGGRAAAFVAVCCWAYLGVILGVWLLLAAADLWWPATFLMFSPRWLLALPLAVLVPAALAVRRRSLGLLAATPLLIAGPVMGFCVPWRTLFTPPPDGPRLRVLTCNMHYRRLPPAPLDDLVAGQHPDVVALQEWHEANRSAVMTGPDWHVRRSPRLFLASRHPLRRVTRLGNNSDKPQGSVTRYDLETPAGVVAFFSLHLASPRHELREAVLEAGKADTEVQASSDLRWEQCENLARQAVGVREPVLLAGDFNTPPESAIFRRLWGDYTDAFSAAGWGWGYTFFGGRTMVRIDHVLAGKGWSCPRAWVGPDLGSPHRPVLADLVWTGPAGND